ncbi:MAG: serine hydrolase domain-containing protein [Roseiflexaceae bacterium]
MSQTSLVWSAQRRWPHTLRRLLAVCALLLAIAPAPAAPARALGPDDLAPYLGRYHPNTTIELRGDQLWLARPPYESQLLPIGDGLFGFTQGYLHGTPLRFANNDDGSASILLLSSAGAWYEFARTGSPYPIDPVLAAALDRVLDQSVADMGIPGVVLAISVPGQGTWAGARGVADRDAGRPMVPTDHFRIASITKMFVATVALQLVQEGWLLLDHSVEHWLPGLVPNGDQITVRQLLSHTSGIYDYLNEAFVERALAEPGRVWSPEELVAEAAQHTPVFAPGAPGRWSYSNTNYVLLGMIVERVTHYPLHVEIRNRILDPLGLRDTFFEPFEAPPGVVRSYERQRDLTDINMSFAWGAGSITSTTEDLARFVQALFGGALLRPETFDLMQSTYGGHGTLSYGLGLMQDQIGAGIGADDQPRPAALVRGHTGGLIGSRTALWYLPERGITVAVAINLMRADPNRVAERALDAVLASLGN